MSDVFDCSVHYMRSYAPWLETVSLQLLVQNMHASGCAMPHLFLWAWNFVLIFKGRAKYWGVWGRESTEKDIWAQERGMNTGRTIVGKEVVVVARRIRWPERIARVGW
jgi:hypothetical protein